MKPTDPLWIERQSMQIIDAELSQRGIALPPEHAHIIKRAIHASADFSYATQMRITQGAKENALQALAAGATIVTDTQMALSGISKPALTSLGCKACCFIAEAETASLAVARGITRSAASMEIAAMLSGPLLFAIGNAPTALLCLADLVRQGRLQPALIIGVPVGFVNVVESKELLLQSGAPCMVALGRKGGSGIAAAMVNALLYEKTGREMW